MYTDMYLLHWWFKNPNDSYQDYFDTVIRSLNSLKVGIFIYEEEDVDLEPTYGFGGAPHYQLDRGREVKSMIPKLIEELWETQGTRAKIRETLNQLSTMADDIRTELKYETTMVSYFRFVDGSLDMALKKEDIELDWEEFRKQAQEQITVQKWVLNQLHLGLKIASENITDPKDLIADSRYQFIGKRKDLIEIVFALLNTAGVTSTESNKLSKEQFYRDFLQFFKVKPGKAAYATELKSLVTSRKGEKISKVLSPAVEALRAEKAK